MNKEFKFEINKKPMERVVEIELQGNFDESARLPEVQEIGDFEKILRIDFDLKKVSYINSSGIKVWIHFVEELEKFGHVTFHFHNCPKQWVDQMNMIHGFLPAKSKVDSLVVPLYCEKCDRTFNIMKNSTYIKDDWEQIIYDLKELDCESFPACKKDLEIDIEASLYFDFLKSQEES
ncbi:MAG: hypothetical protein AAF203_00080 [Pseudomonadota bacterium]